MNQIFRMADWKTARDLFATAAGFGTGVGLLLLMNYCSANKVPFPIGDIAGLATVAFATTFFVSMISFVVFVPMLVFPRGDKVFRNCFSGDSAIDNRQRLKFYLFVPVPVQLLIALSVLSIEYAATPSIIPLIFFFVIYIVTIYIGAGMLRAAPLGFRDIVPFFAFYGLWAIMFCYIVVMLVAKTEQPVLYFFFGTALMVYVGMLHFLSIKRGEVTLRSTVFGLLFGLVVLAGYPTTGAWLGGVGLNLLGLGGGKLDSVVQLRGSSETVSGKLMLSIGPVIYLKDDAIVGVPVRSVATIRIE
jgi:hypothetical protein